jgi:hypothetical protein
MDIPQLYNQIEKEKYEKAMNNLPIYERAVIKNVIHKIREDEWLGNFCNEIEIERKKREEARILIKEQEAKIKKERKAQRRNTKMKAVGVLCAGTVVYVGATLIMR